MHLLQKCDVDIIAFELAPSKTRAEARKEKVKSLLKKKGSLPLLSACWWSSDVLPYKIIGII